MILKDKIYILITPVSKTFLMIPNFRKSIQHKCFIMKKQLKLNVKFKQKIIGKLNNF